MRSISGRLEPGGPSIDVTVMLTAHHVARAKAAGLPSTGTVNVRALVDTGASLSALDAMIVARLGPIQTGRVTIHTSAGYEERDQYDASIFLGSQVGEVKSFTVGVISTDLASEGFFAIIGWDILNQCILTCEGPARSFRLDY